MYGVLFKKVYLTTHLKSYTTKIHDIRVQYWRCIHRITIPRTMASPSLSAFRTPTMHVSTEHTVKYPIRGELTAYTDTPSPTLCAIALIIVRGMRRSSIKFRFTASPSGKDRDYQWNNYYSDVSVALSIQPTCSQTSCQLLSLCLSLSVTVNNREKRVAPQLDIVPHFMFMALLHCSQS